METRLPPWAVCRGALIVLIIRKFFLPSSQNLPCCSLSPLFLVLSAADTKNRLFLSSAAALYVFEDFHHVFLGLLSLRLNKTQCHRPPRCLPTSRGCRGRGMGFAHTASMGEAATASAPSQGEASRKQSLDVGFGGFLFSGSRDRRCNRRRLPTGSPGGAWGGGGGGAFGQ